QLGSQVLSPLLTVCRNSESSASLADRGKRASGNAIGSENWSRAQCSPTACVVSAPARADQVPDLQLAAALRRRSLDAGHGDVERDVAEPRGVGRATGVVAARA